MSALVIRRLVLIMVLAAAAWFGHPPILRALAGLLIVDQSSDGADFFCLRGDEYGSEGDRSYDAAAAWQTESLPAGHGGRERSILLIEPFPHRTVEIGVMPSFENLSRRELLRRGVPEKAIVLLPGQARDIREEVHLLKTWMDQRPQGLVVVACNRFHTRYWRNRLDSMLPGEVSARVRVAALSDRRYDESNWWKSASGVKGVMYACLQWINAWRQTASPPPPERRSAEQYQRVVQTVLEGGQP